MTQAPRAIEQIRAVDRLEPRHLGLPARARRRKARAGQEPVAPEPPVRAQAVERGLAPAWAAPEREPGLAQVERGLAQVEPEPARAREDARLRLSVKS
jgi:hypothetical protein